MMIFHKLPYCLPCPWAKRPFPKLWCLDTKWENGIPHFIDHSKKWPIKLKIKEFYLSKTLVFRQKIISFIWAWKWKLGIHPYQKRKKDVKN